MICNTFCIAFSFHNGDYYSEEFGIDNEESICFSSESPNEGDFSTIERVRAFIENKIRLSYDQTKPFSAWFGELGDPVSFDDLFVSVGQSEFSNLDVVVLLINDDAEHTYRYVKVKISPYSVFEGEERAIWVSSKRSYEPTPLEFVKKTANPPRKVIAPDNNPSSNAIASDKKTKTVIGISKELFEKDFTFHEVEKDFWTVKKGYYIDSYIGDSAVVRVPSFVEGKAVAGINSLGNRPDVRGIVIPDTVTYQDNAFIDCPGLYQHDGSLIIKNRLVSSRCNSSVLTFPNGIKVIGSSSIPKEEGTLEKKNTTIEEIIFPDGLLKIERGAFSLCVNLKKISFPDSLEAIENAAFSRCEQLSEIDLPDHVKIIGDYAFHECRSLKKTRVPATALIGDCAFERCPAAENGLTVVNGILFDIDYDAHQKYIGNTDTKVTKVQLPASVQALSNQSLEWIGAIIDEVVITDSVKDIHKDAFNVLGIKQFYVLNHVSGKTIFKTAKFKSSISAYTHLNESESFLKMCDCICRRDYEALAQYGTVYPDNFSPKTNASGAGDSMLMTAQKTDSHSAAEKEIKTAQSKSSKTTKQSPANKPKKNTEEKPDSTVLSPDAKSVRKKSDSRKTDADHTSASEPAPIKKKTTTKQKKKAVSEGLFVSADKTATRFNGSDIYVVMPDDVQKIANKCFAFNRRMMSVSLPKDLVKIYSKAFFGCCSLRMVDIPEGTAEIAAEAFRSCVSLTDIYIPQSVTTIGKNALDTRCVKTVIHVVPGSKAEEYCRSNGITYDYSPASEYVEKNINLTAEASCDEDFVVEKGTLTHYLGKAKHIIVPDGVKRLSSGVFSNDLSVESVQLPEELPKIPYSTFKGCIGLTDIKLPDSVQAIEDEAFDGCSNLKRIVFPESLQMIGNWAFRNCSGLEELILPDSIQELGEYAFSDCSGLQSLSLPKGLKKITTAYHYSILSGYSETKELLLFNGIKKLTVPCPPLIDDHTSAYSYDFHRCRELESITFLEGWETLPVNCLLYSKKLKTVTLPNTLRTIERGAFEGCDALEEIILPENVETISERAFYGCKNLRWIKLPESLQTIEKEAFRDAGLQVVVLPDSLHTIGDSAFQSCKSLMEIELPNSIVSCGKEIFLGCTNLRVVMLPKNLQTFSGDLFWYCNNLNIISISMKLLDLCDPVTKSTIEVILKKCAGIPKEPFYTYQWKDVIRAVQDAYRVAEEALDKKYQRLNRDMRTTIKSSDWSLLARSFGSLKQYRNAEELAEKCAENARKSMEKEYEAAKQQMQEGEFRIAEKEFRALGAYKDAVSLCRECKEKAEVIEKEVKYEGTVARMSSAKDYSDWINLYRTFLGMGKYQNAEKLTEECMRQANEIKREKELEEARRRQKEDKIASLKKERRDQQAVIDQNKGLGALFGQRAKLRKEAEARLAEIDRELEELQNRE